MPIGETIPTIGELKGNTILELFKNGYNALKNALTRKQTKLVAGDNIVIDEDTNRISAIVGGTPVLEDYYTKSEVNELAGELGEEIDTKADATDVYDKDETYSKTEVDDLISAIPTVDGYTKSETDSLLDAKADKSDTYTETEVDTLLSSKANANDTYTKTEVNNLLSPKANSADVYPKSDVYTKVETNTLLASKADTSSTYTKTEVDNLLSPKANSSDVYGKSEVYTKAQTDALISPLNYEVVDLTLSPSLEDSNRTIVTPVDVQEGDILFITHRGTDTDNVIVTSTIEYKNETYGVQAYPPVNCCYHGVKYNSTNQTISILSNKYYFENRDGLIYLCIRNENYVIAPTYDVSNTVWNLNYAFLKVKVLRRKSQ